MYSNDLLERMDYIQVSVTNLAESVRWYSDHFGFKEDFNNGKLSVLLPFTDATPVGLPTLLLNQAGKNPNWFVDSIGDKHAMHGFHTKRIKELYQHCREKNIECSEVLDEGFAFFLEFYDLDKNMFSVIELKN
ncbi:VOC family protein [Paenibacillus gansuensis]|uniref:VOC family protein n=1 Tax=Paenibacillus gansuensis TaxID=306542 RepID=A0ABW5PGC2_9BACL